MFVNIFRFKISCLAHAHTRQFGCLLKPTVQNAQAIPSLIGYLQRAFNRAAAIRARLIATLAGFVLKEHVTFVE